MKSNKITFALLLIGISMSSYSQRKYSNEFLAIGVSARALGMSNASVASVNDVTAGFWNPAGLSLINQDLQVAAMHSEYFAGIAKFDYLSIARTLREKDMAVGVSFIRFGVDDIPNTLRWKIDGVYDDSRITSFSAADYAFIFSLSKQRFSYGQRRKDATEDTKSFRIGANAKIVHRKVGKFAHSWGFGIDAGAQYYLKKLRLAVMAKDITTTFNGWSFDFTEEEKIVLAQTNNEIPISSLELTMPKFLLGAAYTFDFTEKISLLAELNLDMTTDGKRDVVISAKPVSIDPHLGIEADYDKFIFFRAGIGNIQLRSTNDEGKKITTIQPNLGVGFRIKGVTIDYAYSNIGKSLGYYSHVVSLKAVITKQAKQIKKKKR